MATITSLGIGTNGLDTETLVTKLVAVQHAPIDQLNTRTNGLKTQLSAYGKLQSALATLKDAATKLTNPDTWNSMLASSTDAASVTVTADSSNSAGSYAVSVAKVATSQTLASAALPSSGAIGSGSITIQLGTWNSDQSGFTAKSGSNAVTIDIAPGEDSLTQIRDKINAAQTGVVASIVTDASGARLVMRSSDTGVSNGFQVSVSDADGSNGDAQGLSALAFDPSSGIGSMTQKLAAGNASAVINGIEVESESNTLKGSIDGLTLNLLKPTTSDVTLTVGQDKDSLKKAVTDFSTAYNAVISLVRDQTKVVPREKGSTDASQSGPLVGDSTAIGLLNQLRGIAGGSTSLGGALSRLADIGLNPGTDGTLSVNASKLDKALANPSDLKQFFMGLDSANDANSGLAQRIRSFASDALNSDGRVTTRQQGLQARIDANDKQASRMEDNLSLVEQRLRAQYTALDTQMGKLNSLSTYVSQQMALLSK